MTKNYEAPVVELVKISLEECFLGLSSGSGNASGENMSVGNEEDW